MGTDLHGRMNVMTQKVDRMLVKKGWLLAEF